MPEVCSSRSSTMIGRRSAAQDQASALHCRLALYSDLHVGKGRNIFADGSSSAICRGRPAISAATLVMVLVTEWIGKIASAVIGAAYRHRAWPKHLKMTRWPCCSIGDRAGNPLRSTSPLMKSSMPRVFRPRAWPRGGRTVRHRAQRQSAAQDLAKQRKQDRRNACHLDRDVLALSRADLKKTRILILLSLLTTKKSGVVASGMLHSPAVLFSRIWMISFCCPPSDAPGDR